VLVQLECVLPFSIDLKLGLPVAEQVVFAVKRAVVGGQLRAGDAFPSVRVLSQELRINPNTAHKVVAALVDEGVLVTTPGIGSVVAAPEAGGRRERNELLGPDVERLVVEAKKLGLDEAQVLSAISAQWAKLRKNERPPSHR
jgi:GntR family transcriptional regulator